MRQYWQLDGDMCPGLLAGDRHHDRTLYWAEVGGKCSSRQDVTINVYGWPMAWDDREAVSILSLAAGAPEMDDSDQEFIIRGYQPENDHRADVWLDGRWPWMPAR